MAEVTEIFGSKRGDGVRTGFVCKKQFQEAWNKTTLLYATENPKRGYSICEACDDRESCLGLLKIEMTARETVFPWNRPKQEEAA